MKSESKIKGKWRYKKTFSNMRLLKWWSVIRLINRAIEFITTLVLYMTLAFVVDRSVTAHPKLPLSGSSVTQNFKHDCEIRLIRVLRKMFVLSSSSLHYRKAINFDDYIPGVRGLGCAKITNENSMIKTCRCKLKTTCYKVLICC